MPHAGSCVRALLVCVAFGCPVAAGAQAPFFEPAPDPRQPSRLAISASADVPAVVPGRPVTLRLDMTPARGIHVYAPGNRDYIPVTVTLAASPGVQVRPAVYPPGTDYVFGELEEIVKVYSSPFQVRQPVVVSPAAAKAAGASITITGAVRYQACDDKVCFPPATAPIEITLPIRSPRR
jgi:DsbC/DsbD-like thiol-disulfide interchange protein